MVKEKTVILLPTYNERENVALIVPEIFAACPDVFVCVIDDNSPDGTQKVVQDLQKRYPNLSLLAREKKQGLGEAYKAGMQEVLKDPAVTHVMTMDADGSHSAEYLPAMLKSGKTYDLVIGSRYVKGGGIEQWEAWRFWLSSLGNIYARAITGLPVRDMTAGFVLFRADKLRQLDFSALQTSGYAFTMETKFIFVRSLGASVEEIPIIFKTRREGESKISRHIITEGLKTPWRLRYKKIFTILTCPLCGSKKISAFGVKNGYSLFTCGSCDLLFVHPIPHNLEAIYGSDYFIKKESTEFGYIDYDKDKEPMRGVFEQYLRRLESLVPGRKIFDIGAATGYFLDLAEKRGWETYGSEISGYAAQEAASRGHAVNQGNLPSFPNTPDVDSVVMWDVLEHVDDPRAYLSAVNRMLPRGGVLALSTPDRGSVFAHIMGLRWHLIVPPEHLYYYSKNNLATLLKECGFEVLETAKPSKRFSLSYIFNTLQKWQGLALWGVFARATDTSFFRMFALPINLRDNIFIIARKKL